MHEGTIVSVKIHAGYGFIAGPNQPDVFFHACDLASGLEFDEQLMERRVVFDIVGTDKGPRAMDIKPAE